MSSRGVRRLRVRNVHQRMIDAPASAVQEWVSTLGTPDDQLWPTDLWFPMRLDAPVAEGGRGGHGPVRYHCVTHTTEKTEFVFDSIGTGTHTFWIDDHGASTILRHELVASFALRERLAWAFVVRPLHDALLEDLLHGAQVRAGGSPSAPRWSPWVRLLRRLFPNVRAAGPEGPGHTD